MTSTAEVEQNSSRWLAASRWSRVVSARDGTGAEARQALERLCATYRPPLDSYARRLGWGPEDARDLTQAYSDVDEELWHLLSVLRG